MIDILPLDIIGVIAPSCMIIDLIDANIGLGNSLMWP